MNHESAAQASLDETLQAIADVARRHDLWIGVAESLTSGAVASRLGAAPQAADWFRGGVVAYHESVKFDVLGVTPGPVVTQRCAWQMAVGAAELLGADIALGVTGVGGPEPSEGSPPGTVIMAVVAQGVHDYGNHHFPGEPEDVVNATVEEAVRLLAAATHAHLRRTFDGTSSGR